MDTTSLFRWSKQSSGIILASLQATSLFTQAEPLCAEQDCNTGFHLITSQPHLLPTHWSWPIVYFLRQHFQLSEVCQYNCTNYARPCWWHKEGGEPQIDLQRPGNTARHWSSLSRCEGALNWTFSHYNLFSPAECKGQGCSHTIPLFPEWEHFECFGQIKLHILSFPDEASRLNHWTRQPTDFSRRLCSNLESQTNPF